MQCQRRFAPGAANIQPGESPDPLPFSTLALPVIPHQLVRPGGLAHGLARQKLGEHGLDVEDRRAVDGVEPAHVQRAALALFDLHDRRADPVRPRLATLREDPDLGPGRVAARMPGARDNGRLGDPIEEKNDLGVRKRLQAVEALGGKMLRKLKLLGLRHQSPQLQLL